jgi:hypothetical protein
MAQPYQIPGNFQVPSLAETSALAGNDNIQAEAQMDQFTRQATAWTNILNANRDQSLRERQFAQQMVNADRNFQLTRDQQEFNWVNSNRDFELRKDVQKATLQNTDLQYRAAKYNLDRAMADNEAMSALANKTPELMTEFESSFGQNPGYSADFLKNYTQFQSRYAKTPATAQALRTMFQPYFDQNEQFKNAHVQDNLGNLESYLYSGDLGEIHLGGTVKEDGTKEGGISGVDAYAQISAGLGSRDQVERTKAVGMLSALTREVKKYETMKSAAARVAEAKQIAGVTNQGLMQFKIGPTGEVESQVGTTRYPYAGRGVAGPAGMRAMTTKEVDQTKAEIQLIEGQAADLNKQLENLDSSSPQYASIQSQIDDLDAKKEIQKEKLSANDEVILKKLQGQVNPTTPGQTPAEATGPSVSAPMTGAPSYLGEAPSIASYKPKAPAPKPSVATEIPAPKPVSTVEIAGEQLDVVQPRKTLAEGMEMISAPAKAQLQTELAGLQAKPAYTGQDPLKRAAENARRNRISEINKALTNF